MPAIGDSSSVLDSGRTLPQHQALLTLLVDRIADPSVEEYRWLDIACGRGQVVASATRALSRGLAAKIRFLACDINDDYLKEALQRAKALFGSADRLLCEVRDIEQLLVTRPKYDLITMTNAAHEIEPRELASLLVTCMCRTTPNGICFFYDMESLPEFELGAIPWRPSDIEKVFGAVFEVVGLPKHLISVQQWEHRSCNGWSVALNRRYWNIEDDTLDGARDEMVDAAAKAITAILFARMTELHLTLETLCLTGCRDDETRKRAGFMSAQFWAVTRAIGLNTPRDAE